MAAQCTTVNTPISPIDRLYFLPSLAIGNSVSKGPTMSSKKKTLEFFRYLLIDKSTRQSLEKINTGSKSIIQTQTYQVSPLKSPLFSLCHKNGLTNTQYIYNFYLCSLTLTSLHRISPRVSVITFHNLEKRFITNSGITR